MNFLQNEEVEITIMTWKTLHKRWRFVRKWNTFITIIQLSVVWPWRCILRTQTYKMHAWNKHSQRKRLWIFASWLTMHQGHKHEVATKIAKLWDNRLHEDEIMTAAMDMANIMSSQELPEKTKVLVVGGQGSQISRRTVDWNVNSHRDHPLKL